MKKYYLLFISLGMQRTSTKLVKMDYLCLKNEYTRIIVDSKSYRDIYGKLLIFSLSQNHETKFK